MEYIASHITENSHAPLKLDVASGEVNRKRPNQLRSLLQLPAISCLTTQQKR